MKEKSVIKKLITVLVIFLLLPINVNKISAADKDLEELDGREKIEDLFRNLQYISLMKEMQDIDWIESDCTIISEDETNLISSAIEMQLEELGVRKLNPDDPEDMKLLDELPAQREYSGVPLTGAQDYAPTLNAIAGLYSLFYESGNYYYQGVEYPFRYIRVIDDKGYGKLTVMKSFDMGPKKNSVILLSELFDYNFKYILSSFLGIFPGGAILDWTLNNIITGLNTIDQNNTITYGAGNNENNAYIAHQGSVTQMTYYYIYYNNVWRMVGASATAELGRLDSCMINCEGELIKFHEEHDNWNIKTGGGYWYDFMKRYLEKGVNSVNYLDIHSFGSIKMRGIFSDYIFEPAFFDEPMLLI